MFDCPWALRLPADRIVVAIREENNGSTVSDFGYRSGLKKSNDWNQFPS
jgi:hypothetical protein